jgi:hypothetical protein
LQSKWASIQLVEATVGPYVREELRARGPAQRGGAPDVRTSGVGSRRVQGSWAELGAAGNEATRTGPFGRSACRRSYEDLHGKRDASLTAFIVRTATTLHRCVSTPIYLHDTYRKLTLCATRTMGEQQSWTEVTNIQVQRCSEVPPIARHGRRHTRVLLCTRALACVCDRNSACWSEFDFRGSRQARGAVSQNLQAGEVSRPTAFMP